MREQHNSRIVVTFEDNRYLTQLLGEHDYHLAIVQNYLGINAHGCGNAVILEGDRAACKIAQDVLEVLYKRAKENKDIIPDDFDSLIRHAKDSNNSMVGQGEVRTRRRIIKARTQAQSTYIALIQNRDLVFGVGPAGTGKTYLAVAVAASYLERGLVSRIILSRPAVEAGERLGFLPGDLRDKVDPYLRPLYDALYDVLAPEKVEKDLESGTIEIAPLAFMRGRTLAGAFVILDEAQNATRIQTKMFLTRLGEGSKMVITGDPSQIDLPVGQKSGLLESVELLKGIDDTGSVHFQESDIVRRDLVAKIVKAYNHQNILRCSD
ncbi:MAG: PhoH family protein [Hyphomicrobiaceae bacterium]|nr:PhoH family protein [Hyphomicrobiaceae bacterium]